MCYIAIKIGNHLNREIKYLLNMESKRNSDGFAFTGINLKDKGVKIHKTMNYKTNEIKSEIKKDFFMSHLRFGTNGTKTIENIHLWKKGNWIFSHNGTISGYANDKQKVDSLIFYQEMFKQKAIIGNVLDITKIESIAGENSFWGRFTLYNWKSKKLYLFGDWKTLSSKNSDSVIITSKESILDEIYKRHGFSFESESTNYIYNEIEPQVSIVNLIKNTFKKISEWEPMDWSNKGVSDNHLFEHKKEINYSKNEYENSFKTDRELEQENKDINSYYNNYNVSKSVDKELNNHKKSKWN